MDIADKFPWVGKTVVFVYHDAIHVTADKTAQRRRLSSSLAKLVSRHVLFCSLPPTFLVSLVKVVPHCSEYRKISYNHFGISVPLE